MKPIKIIVKQVKFPSIAGFEQHEFAYRSLKSCWRHLSLPVRNLEHFLIYVRTRQLSDNEEWLLVAEYREGRTVNGALREIDLRWEEPAFLQRLDTQVLLPIGYKL